jgi:hypothetical protein
VINEAERGDLKRAFKDARKVKKRLEKSEKKTATRSLKQRR